MATFHSNTTHASTSDTDKITRAASHTGKSRDGDGVNNLFEYIAGLVPTDPLSRFMVRAKSVPGHPEQKAIIFRPLVTGRTYNVKYKSGPTDPAWTPLTEITASEDGEERTITDLSAGAGPRF